MVPFGGGARRLACGGLLVGAASAGHACALPSMDEFARGSPADLARDGGADGAARVDASTGDGGGAGDPDAGGTPTCPASALFCDDFEGALGAKWSHREENGGGVAVGEGATGGGLDVQVGLRGPLKQSAVHLEQPISLAPRTPFSVSFDLRVSRIAEVGIVDLDCFRFRGNFSNVGLRVADYGGGTLVRWYGDPIGAKPYVYEERSVEPLQPNRWTRVTCSVTYPDGAVELKLAYDGREVFRSSIPIGDYVSGSLHVAAGVTKTERPGAAITLGYDNFVVTSP